MIPEETSIIQQPILKKRGRKPKVVEPISDLVVNVNDNESKSKETKIKQPKEPKYQKEPKEPKLTKKIKEPKEPKSSKLPKDNDTKKPKEPKQPKPPKEPKKPKEPKEPKPPKEPKQPKPPKEPKQPKKIKQIKEDDENDDNYDENDDIAMKTKRRGRKPKDKFKFESSEIDEFHKNNKKDENIIVKLPLSCLKLNEEFNICKDLFPYNPNLSVPKPYNPEHLITKGNISFSMLNNVENNDEISDDNENIYLQDKPFDNTNNNNNTNNITNKTFNTKELYENQNQNQNQYQQNQILNNNSNIIKQHNHDQFCAKCLHCQQLKNSNGDIRQIDIILNNKYNSNTDKFNVLTHLGINLNGGKWVEKTDVACLWCCHSFTNNPWGIPYKFSNNTFQLFGNFCMPNCALAYTLQFYKDDDNLWEKVALLNLLYFKVFKQYKNLIPSFDKMALKLFGGTLEIDEYRNIILLNDKTFSIEFPPCNTIIPMLEEIYKKSTLSNTFIPVDKNRINIAANNELKLKRSKPITNHKNTLDFCLGKIK